MERQHAVLILMGSDSDLLVMGEAAEVLDSLGVAVEVHIASAHRTPIRAIELASNARDQGFSAIIAGAGLAAHLPGVVAAFTTLPVIGVPLSAGALRGADALHAIVQMPPGVPVATVAIDGGRNAGLLAAQMIGAHDAEMAERLAAHRHELADGVAAKDSALQSRPNKFAATSTPIGSRP